MIARCIEHCNFHIVARKVTNSELHYFTGMYTYYAAFLKVTVNTTYIFSSYFTMLKIRLSYSQLT